MGTQRTPRNDGFSNPRWQRALGGGRPRQRDPNAMDVDVVQISGGKLSDAERQRLRAEGRCFYCKVQGHMSPQCPKKQNQPCTRNPNQFRPRPLATRTTEVEEIPTETNDAVAMTSRRAMLKGIQGLSAEERAHLLDELIVSDHQSSTSF